MSNVKSKENFIVNELFNNADGNDDILSDMGGGAGGNEIRTGMWAQMPYSVSDGGDNSNAVINEDYNRNVADIIAKKVAIKIGLSQPSFLGSGFNGVAYDIGDEKVLKVTKDNSEANDNIKMIGKSLKYIAQPYNVFEVNSKSNPEMPRTFVIILEKLKTDPNIQKSYDRLDYAFNDILGVKFPDVIEYYLGDWDDGKVKKEQVESYLRKNPRDAEFFGGILKIAEELRALGIDSMDYLNTDNLGYKKNGALGFFDVGFGDYYAKPEAEKMEVAEDGSAKFSTDDAIGQDGFPTYNTNDTSPMINNNLDANIAMYEDLEYNHVKGDATDDEYMLAEVVEGGEYQAYHGSMTKIDKFVDDFVGKEEATDQEGPGIYFSTNIDDARAYGQYVHSVILRPRKLVDESSHEDVNKNEVIGLIKTAPDWKDTAQNWAEDPESGLYTAVDSLYKYSQNEKDLFQQIWYDWFRYSPLEYVRGMVKLGYDGQIINKAQGNKHFIVYNPNIIEVTNAEELNERDKSYGKGSRTVKVKRKCQLGGLGNTSVACNQGDMSNLELGSVNDGVADKYAEKKFGIEPEFNDFEEKYDKKKSLEQNQVVYNGNFVIIKNPENLNNLGDSVRGVIDTEGNLYIEQKSVVIHQGLIKRLHELGILKMSYVYSIGEILPSEYITVQRFNKTDKIVIGESNNQMGLYNRLYDKAAPVFQKFMDAAKRKNPEIDFVNQYINDYRGNQEQDNLELSSIKEEVDIDSDFVSGWHSYTVENDGEDVGEIEVSNKEKFMILNKILIHPEHRQHGYADEVMKLLFEYANQNKKIIALTPDNVWGANKEKLKRWYKSLGFVMNKGRNKDFQVRELMIKKPESLEITEYFSSLVPDMNENIMSIEDLPFREEVEQLGGKIYSVGGAVRDEFLGLESKDLDVLITGIPLDQLQQILSKYGSVSLEGDSFAVLIFRPKGSTESMDIAIPRTETPTGGGGHQDFDVKGDHTLPIEKDLERRDITINAIAKDMEGNLIDPYGGQEDLKNKIIRVVNPDSFSDDPLRMLRAVQFGSRFGGFQIEPKTMQMIIDNASDIKKIKPERLILEFGKIIDKGNPRVGVELLASTGLFKQIFGNEIHASQIGRRDFESVKTMAEFLFLMMDGVVQNPPQFFLSRFSTENAKRSKIFKEMRALEAAFDSGDENMSPADARHTANQMFLIAPQTLESQILPSVVENAAQELLQGKYPKTVNDLAINGNDLIQANIPNNERGDLQKSLLEKVYADEVRNNREDLLSLISSHEGEMQEGYSYYEDLKPTVWNVNDKQVGVDFFVDKYDKWNNQGGVLGYRDASKESVLEFLQNNYEDFSTDEKLKRELYWALTDRDLLGEEEVKKVSYSAVVLDDKSHAALLKIFAAMIPEGWETLAHHMTIKMGALENGSDEKKDLSGETEITLDVVDYAKDDLVMAVGVVGYSTTNAKPHITIAVNREAGGKPFFSNRLTDWKPVGFPIALTGKVKQV